MDRRLDELRRRRRQVFLEASCALAGSAALASLHVERMPGSAAFAVALALALALYLAASVRFCARLARLLAAACPRCGGLFFVSWQRLLVSLPYLHASCAHCGCALARRRS